MTILRNPTQEELVKVIHTNRNEFFKSVWNTFDAKVIKKENYSFYITGIPIDLLNAVIYTCRNSELISIIDEIISFASEKEIPFRFHVKLDDDRKKLLEELTNRGFIFQTHPGMVLDLNKLEKTKLNLDNKKIVKVKSKKEMELVKDVIVKVYAETENEAKLWERHVTSTTKNPQHNLYLALLNEEPVGVSEVCYYNGVAGIYTVGTISEARGKGIGTTITKAPLFDAKELGFEWALLHSSEMGYNVYKKIGFQELGPYTIARWIPE